MNNSGQLGDGTIGNRLIPTVVTGLYPILGALASSASTSINAPCRMVVDEASRLLLLSQALEADPPGA